MSFQSPYRFVYMCALMWFSTSALHAQNAKPVAGKEKPKLPTISDEPKTNDPAVFMPTPLAKAATADFTESSLREVLVWLREKQGLVVLLDNDALKEIQVLPGDPIADRLDKTPIYLLLNRLRSLGIAWYFEDEILHFTSTEVAEQRLTTIPYNIGDMLDAKYDSDGIGEVIVSAISPDSWEDAGGAGAVSFLGDVMFVRQTDQLHRQVRGLLAALRKHGRRTFTLDPPQHALLRQKLEENVKAAFNDTPLETVVEQLAQTAKIDIRLDMPALRENRIRQREPVTLSLNDRKLKTVLRAMLIDLKLTWILRDGVLWITSRDEAEAFLKTAVFDVRDLCRDDAESEALTDAIVSQTNENWEEQGGAGTIEFARPGTLVIHNTERMLDEVLNLLETYRTALRASKPRLRAEDDPNQVITVYYRMHADVAKDLTTLLPKLVRPDTWKNDAHPDAAGELFRTSSEPGNSNLDNGTGVAPGTNQSQQTFVMDRAVLIIRQTRAAHDDIEDVITRVEAGDPRKSDGFGGGLGGGMGGFGGGFMSVKPQKAAKPRK